MTTTTIETPEITFVIELKNMKLPENSFRGMKEELWQAAADNSLESEEIFNHKDHLKITADVEAHKKDDMLAAISQVLIDYNRRAELFVSFGNRVKF